MKKTIAILSAVVLALTLAGCTKPADSKGGNTLKDGVTLESMVNQINASYGNVAANTESMAKAIDALDEKATAEEAAKAITEAITEGSPEGMKEDLTLMLVDYYAALQAENTPVTKDMLKEYTMGYCGQFSLVPMATDLETMFPDGLDETIVEESAGVISMSMTSSDRLIAVKAKTGKIEDAKKLLETMKTDVMKTFEQYNVMGSYDRAQQAEVYTKGDYAFLLMVGKFGDEATDTPDFAKDRTAVKTEIDKNFQ